MLLWTRCLSTAKILDNNRFWKKLEGKLCITQETNGPFHSSHHRERKPVAARERRHWEQLGASSATSRANPWIRKQSAKRSNLENYPSKSRARTNEALEEERRRICEKYRLPVECSLNENTISSWKPTSLKGDLNNFRKCLVELLIVEVFSRVWNHYAQYLLACSAVVRRRCWPVSSHYQHY